MDSRKGSRPAWLLLLAPAASHIHIRPLDIVVAVIAIAVLYVLLALARPTKPCGRCHGERVVITRHWLTGRVRTRPCRRCSGTGRTPRLGARALHRLVWSIRSERSKS